MLDRIPKNNVSIELRTGSHGYFEMRDIEEIWGGALHHKNKVGNKNHPQRRG